MTMDIAQTPSKQPNMITKAYSLAKGQTRSGAGPKDGKLLDSNCSTSARNHRKKGGSAPTCSSKGRVGSLHFHPHQALMRYSNPHPSLTLNPHGMREHWVGKLVLSPKPGSDKQFPLPDSVSGDHARSLDLHPRPAVMRAPFTGVVSDEAQWRVIHLRPELTRPFPSPLWC